MKKIMSSKERRLSKGNKEKQVATAKTASRVKTVATAKMVGPVKTVKMVRPASKVLADLPALEAFRGSLVKMVKTASRAKMAKTAPHSSQQKTSLTKLPAALRHLKEIELLIILPSETGRGSKRTLKAEQYIAEVEEALRSRMTSPRNVMVIPRHLLSLRTVEFLRCLVLNSPSSTAKTTTATPRRRSRSATR